MCVFVKVAKKKKSFLCQFRLNVEEAYTNAQIFTQIVIWKWFNLCPVQYSIRHDADMTHSKLVTCPKLIMCWLGGPSSALVYWTEVLLLENLFPYK